MYASSLSQKSKPAGQGTSPISVAFEYHPFAEVLERITAALVNVAKDSSLQWHRPRANFAYTLISTLQCASPLLDCYIDHSLVPAGSRSRDLEKVAHAAMYEYFLTLQYRRQLFATQASSVRLLLGNIFRHKLPFKSSSFLQVPWQHPDDTGDTTIAEKFSDQWKFPDGIPSFPTAVSERVVNVRKASALSLQKKNFRLIQELVTLVTTSPVARLSSLRYPADDKAVIAVEVRDGLAAIVEVSVVLRVINVMPSNYTNLLTYLGA